MTIQATKELLKYLTERIGFKYLMTSRLSQDCIERSFGIVRQASGANDHPTPAQFIVIIRCMSFYSLAKSPKGGNVSPGLLESLLSAEQVLQNSENQDEALDSAAVPKDVIEIAVDHADYVEKHSDSRLVYYIAGYVARKRILPRNCEACRDASLVRKDNIPDDLPADIAREWDMGGLLYPSLSLYTLIQAVENRLTEAFSKTRLHSKVVGSILREVGSGGLPRVGCDEHQDQLTESVVRFFCIARMHFLLKGLNQEENEKKCKRPKPCTM